MSVNREMEEVVETIFEAKEKDVKYGAAAKMWEIGARLINEESWASYARQVAGKANNWIEIHKEVVFASPAEAETQLLIELHIEFSPKINEKSRLMEFVEWLKSYVKAVVENINHEIHSEIVNKALLLNFTD